MVEEKDTLGKFMKEIYINNELVDKLWIEGYGKPEKGMLETLLYKDCCDDRVIMLIGSDSGTRDLIMEGEKISGGSSDGVCFDYHESIRRAIVLRGILNAPDFDDAKQLGEKDREEQENKCSEGEDKEADGTNTVEVSPIGEIKSQEVKNTVHNLETEREVHESFNCHLKFPGCLPYSGSVSHRSTSSTASAQSFAFPVLAEDWKSSPVRMAKADKRQLRKKKGWICRMKTGWFCCRF